MDLSPSLPELLDRIRGLQAGPGERLVIGIVGAPGAGKSTLAAALVAGLRADGATRAVQVPMDGFHLADVQLNRLGLRHVKGAPPTFDGDGYAALLGRLRHDRTRPVYTPNFERDLEQPLAGAIVVEPEDDIIITEGNYLLLQDDPWPSTRSECHDVWFVDVADDVRLPRLIARHVQFGKTADEAHEWVMRNDEANTAVVKASAAGADLTVTMGCPVTMG